MNRGLQYLRNYGLKATAMAAVRSSRTRLKNLFSEPDRSLPYRFATHPIPYAHSAPEAAGRRVNWVIPGFYRGSGGHTTIFRISELLEKQGYDVHFYIMGPTMYANDHEATHSMRTHYFPLKGMVHIDLTQMRPADTCIASAWETAYAVRDFKACRRKIYFVQDFESAFFSSSTESVLAEQTYRFGFDCVCAGRWLDQKMKAFGSKSAFIELAYDREKYRAELKPPGRKKVVFYSRHTTPRRGTVLGLLALELFKQQNPDVEIALYGSDQIPYSLPFEHVNLGILTEAQLAHLYASATVGLSISLTNYSLVPQEMLGSGLPVVELDLENTRAIYGKSSAGLRLAAPTPQAIAEALTQVVRASASEQAAMRSSAVALVKDLRWEEAGHVLSRMIEGG